MIDTLVHSIDRLQRRHRSIGFSYAVFTRYREDHGMWLGSLVSYFGFFSLYPLVVVFATVSTWLFKDRPETLQRILEAIWSKVPFADAGVAEAAVQERVEQFGPNPWVLVASLLITLWGGLGVVRVLQDGINTIWGVARFRRPRSVRKLLYSAAMIGLLGLGLIGSAVVAGLALAADLPWGGVVLAAVANLALSAVIALAVFRLTIVTPVTTRELLPGSVVIAAGTFVVTIVGGLYVKSVVARMTGLYGPFASTIGLLAYVSLNVQVFVLGTEINVVHAKRLWPRSMTQELGEPDHRAMRLTMSREALASPDTLDPGIAPRMDA